MKDKLKEFVHENREAFDIYEDDYDKLWHKIDQRLSDQHAQSPFMVVFRKTYRVAAVVLILISIGAAFLIGKRSAVYNQHGIALHNISPEMAETEAFYADQIDNKIELINAHENEISQEIWESLEKLDNDYEALKKDLRDGADTQEVIDAMIKYYRLKLQMLEQILKEINENEGGYEDISI